MRTFLAITTVALLASCTDPLNSPSNSQVGKRPEGSVPDGGSSQVEKSKVIARGTAYNKKDYLVPGYVVILDFYADW